MVYTVQQEKCFQILMYRFDKSLDDLLNFTIEDEDWISLLDKKLDQGSSLTDLVSAGVTLGVALAPVTGGASLAVSGVCGTIAAGITVAKAMNGCVRSLLQNDEPPAFPESEAALAAFKLSLRVGLMEIADAIVVYYAHIINEVMEEASIPVFAKYGALRVMKKLQESLKQQFKEHKDPKVALKVVLEPEVFIDHLMQGTKLSSVSEKITIKDQYHTGNLFGSREMPVKWAFSRSRIALLSKTDGVHYYATPTEQRYMPETTLPCYGYMMPQLFCDASHVIHINHRTLQSLVNQDQIHQAVHPYLTFFYPMSVDELLAYVDSISIKPQSLNDYLTQRFGMQTVGVFRGTLQKCSLHGGDFSGVDFRHASLIECNLENTQWENARLSHSRWLSNLTNEKTSFKGAFLEFSEIQDMTIQGDWSYTRLNYSILTKIKIGQQLLDQLTNWEWAIMTDVQMENSIEKSSEEIKNFFENQLQTMQHSLIAYQEQEDHQIKALEHWLDQMQQAIDHQESINQTLFKELEQIKTKDEQDLIKKMHEQQLKLQQFVLSQPYVEPEIFNSQEKKRVQAKQKIYEFIENDEFVLFIEGQLGCGKTLLSRRIALELAENNPLSEVFHTGDGDLMDILPVWGVKDFSEGNLLISALRKRYSLTEIEILKKHSCIFILDGLDECDIDIQQHYILEDIYQARSEWKNLKIILTATSSYCAQIKGFNERFRLDETTLLTEESRIQIQPFSNEQIDTYFNLYFPQNFSLNDPNFSSRYPVQEIYQMAHNPIMAHIICEVFASNKTKKIPHSVEDFCEVFIQLWYKNIQCKAKHYEYDFQQLDILAYIRTLAMNMFSQRQMYIERPFESEKTFLQRRIDDQRSLLDPKSFAYIFTDPAWKKAGTLMPLSISVNSEKLPVMIRHEFLHKFLYFFALSMELIHLLEHSTVEVCADAWNYNAITEKRIYDFMVAFFSKRCREIPGLENLMIQNLCQIVDLSTRDETKENAASNAITLLNHLKFDFSRNIEVNRWEKIRVSYANLTQAKLSGLNISQGKFEYVRFHHAQLARTNMRNIGANGARFFDATSHLEVEGRPTVITSYANDTLKKEVITYAIPSQKGKRPHKIVNVGVDGTQYIEFLGHQKEVLSMAWGQEGLISSSRSIYLWSTTGDKKTFKPREKTPIHTLNWYKGGPIFVSGGENGNLCVWHTQVNQPIYEVNEGARIRSVLFGQIRLLLSISGKKITSRTFTYQQNVFNIEKEASQSLDTEIYSLALSSSERRIALGLEDGSILIQSMQFVLTGIDDSRYPMRRLSHNKNPIYSVLWTPSEEVISGGEDATIRIWNPTSGECQSILYADSPIYQMQLLSDQRLIASQDRMVSFWNIAQSSQGSARASEIEYRITSLACYEQYLFTGHVNGEVFVWDKSQLHEKKQKFTQHTASVKQIIFSHNQKYCATLDQEDTIHVRALESISSELDTHISTRQLETPTWEIKLTRAVHINQLAWLTDDPNSPNCWLTACTAQGEIFWWKYNDINGKWQEETLLISNLTQDHNIQCIVKQNHFARFVIAFDSTLQIWDFARDTIAPIRTFTIPNSFITQVCWSPDDSCLAVLDQDQNVHLIQMNTASISLIDRQTAEGKQISWFQNDQLYLVISSLEEIKLLPMSEKGFLKAQSVANPGAELFICHQNRFYLVDKTSIQIMLHQPNRLIFEAMLGEGTCVRDTNLSNVQTLKSDERMVLQKYGAMVPQERFMWSFKFFTKKTAHELPPRMPDTPIQKQTSLRCSLYKRVKNQSIWQLNESQTDLNLSAEGCATIDLKGGSSLRRLGAEKV